MTALRHLCPASTQRLVGSELAWGGGRFPSCSPVSAAGITANSEGWGSLRRRNGQHAQRALQRNHPMTQADGSSPTCGTGGAADPAERGVLRRRNRQQVQQHAGHHGCAARHPSRRALLPHAGLLEPWFGKAPYARPSKTCGPPSPFMKRSKTSRACSDQRGCTSTGMEKLAAVRYAQGIARFGDLQSAAK